MIEKVQIELHEKVDQMNEVLQEVEANIGKHVSQKNNNKT